MILHEISKVRQRFGQRSANRRRSRRTGRLAGRGLAAARRRRQLAGMILDRVVQERGAGQVGVGGPLMAEDPDRDPHPAGPRSTWVAAWSVGPEAVVVPAGVLPPRPVPAVFGRGTNNAPVVAASDSHGVDWLAVPGRGPSPPARPQSAPTTTPSSACSWCSHTAATAPSGLPPVSARNGPAGRAEAAVSCLAQPPPRSMTFPSA
jgi:hypothetical protein